MEEEEEMKRFGLQEQFLEEELDFITSLLSSIHSSSKRSSHEGDAAGNFPASASNGCNGSTGSSRSDRNNREASSERLQPCPNSSEKRDKGVTCTAYEDEMARRRIVADEVGVRWRLEQAELTSRQIVLQELIFHLRKELLTSPPPP